MSDNASRLAFLLTDGFALMSYAAIVEPFRAANVLAREPLYRWSHVSLDGGPARASNGASIIADHAVGDSIDCDMLFLFAAGDPTTFDHAPTFAWLRALARRGVAIAGVSGGPFLLARAGLLAGHRAAIHWEHRAAFLDHFPEHALEDGLYVIDRQRISCAGGAAGLDLSIDLIERAHGHDLAAQVSDWFIRTEPRRADCPQRLSFRDRYAVSDGRLVRVLARMEATVEEPAGREELAQVAGLSVRQLERLFRSQLGTSVNAMAMRIRLDQAAQLLRSSGLSVTEAAVACGFQSASHFARAFRARFGIAPSAARAPGQDRARG